ncbi:ABC transporter permease [Aquimarina gracilis]|uniref:ABC transporter permease n=1 Tax=Aquimarina gracilis TaxID=874422 RepID=A0ABU5ZZ91_9FLAO|nr:ABC transporter permease [Aquimarina gracilis]MEB3347209.1 ABC transporter permease [Aquimarina gracilis]
MFKNYIKIAWRNLRKRKVFAFINILGLALGFGCGMLIFLFINHHLQFDNFHENSDQIYRIVTEERSDEIEYEAAVPPGFANAFRNDFNYAQKVTSIYFRDEWQVSTIEDNSSKRFVSDVAFTDSEFFEVFSFSKTEELDNRSLIEPNTAYVTESFAKRMFGKENSLGQSFVLENLETIQIIGILKDLPKNSTIQGEAFISFKTLKAYDNFVSSQSWGGINSDLKCFAVLHPNQNIDHIEASLVPLVSKHRPKSKNVHRYKLQQLKTIHLNSDYGGVNINLLWIFGLIGVFLITIACINFINISTAQAFTRSKEIGVRKVLGGQREHLFWQFISETFIISLFALIIGIMITFLALPKFNQVFDLSLSLQSLFTIKFVLFVLLLLIGVSLFAGSYPGVLLARILPTLALKGKLKQSDTGGHLTRRVLVTAQFVISIILIVATIVVGKQINYAVNADLGFDKDAIVMLSIPRDTKLVKIEGLRDRFTNLAGVKNATACITSPGGSFNNWGTNIKYDHRPESEEFSISAKLADENYINTFDLQLIAGRNFIVSDSITEVVVNERLAEKLGLASPQELIGKYLELNGGRIKATISGVVANFHDQNFESGISPVFIAPRNQNYYEYGIKINPRNTSATLAQIEKLWKEVFPKFIYDFNFLDQRVALQYEEEQRFLSLSKLFSGLAIFISCLGLYGLISFFVAQKTKEIGIRKVLGGKVSDILLLFTQDFFKLILIAGTIASPVAWYFMNNWLENYQYRITIDWWVFAVAIVGITIITIATISYQAIRAAIANPVKSLRAE